MSGEDRPITFTLSQLNLMAFAVREGKANKEDARKLLELFSSSVEYGMISARNQVAARLLEHVCEALQGYLHGITVDQKRTIKSIESAFGLVMREGRPNADEQKRIKMAAEVLRRYLSRTSHQDAVAEVGNAFRRADSVVSEAWRDHRVNAVVLVRLSRSETLPWTNDELPRLQTALGEENESLLRELLRENLGFNRRDGEQ